MNGTAITVLKALYSRSSGSGRVFLSQGGEPLQGPRHWFEPAVRKAGLQDFTWHCLRHTFASRLVMAGVDLRTTQQLMGHKTIQMTCRYAHLAPGHQLAAVERLCAGVDSLARPTDTRTDTDAAALSPERLSVVN